MRKRMGRDGLLGNSGPRCLLNRLAGNTPPPTLLPRSHLLPCQKQVTDRSIPPSLPMRKAGTPRKGAERGVFLSNSTTIICCCFYVRGALSLGRRYTHSRPRLPTRSTNCRDCLLERFLTATTASAHVLVVLHNHAVPQSGFMACSRHEPLVGLSPHKFVGV